MSDVLDENGYHLGDSEQLIASEKAVKVSPEGLDENGYWIGVPEKKEKAPEPKSEKASAEPKPTKVSPKKK